MARHHHGHDHHFHHDHEHGHHQHHHTHHTHDYDHRVLAGHNQGAADHLHSHVHGASHADRAEELQALAVSFIDGFRAADDKTSYLRLAGVPFHRPGADGLIQHLVDAKIVSNWQVGTASPAFASRELVYMSFPGSMVQARETMTFTFVSLSQRSDIDLIDILTTRLAHGDIAE
ncbi:hypothetical protein GFK91_20720 [Roseibium aggregatum]|uniref:hypothetical protein n=1 Tax=Roseibium aggregatum TaxID=187304 RepID=UPI001E369982|nr:hypothetical protein [Roseibium aggregatum]UES57831.1 hypothetical protein GFK91_20720 [Roseibium aggregatum]